MDWQLLLPPLVGAGIGYITNDIAIRMLFRPRKAVYIGKWRMPFTPGLIPKEKDRIAMAIGASIQTHLLNGDILAESLVSEDMLATIRTRLTAFIDGQRENDMTVEEAILQYTDQETLDKTTGDLGQSLAAMIHKKVVELELGEDLSVIALQGIRQKIESSRWSFAKSVLDDKRIDSMSQRTGQMINTMVADRSQEILEDIIGKETDKILETRVCDLIEKYDEKLPDVIEAVLRTYTSVISTHLSKVFDSINISKIIEERVASLEAKELEELIFSIMRKELRAIVYLGALLGFLLGFANLAVGFL